MDNKRALIIGGVVVAVLLIAGVAYAVFGGDDEPVTNTNSNRNANSNANRNANKNSNSNSNKNSNKNSNTNVNSNSNKNSNSNTNTNKNTNSSANKNTNTAPATGSETYTNDRYGFTIKYSEDWVYLEDREELGFYPFGKKDEADDEEYEGEWFISVYNPTTKSLDTLIDDRYDDEEKREEIKVNAHDATKVTEADGSAEAVYFEHNGRIIEVANNSGSSEGFEAFYSSMTFN